MTDARKHNWVVVKTVVKDMLESLKDLDMDKDFFIEDLDREFFEACHRALVVLDDQLCERFDFSRKPRGKYIRRNTDG